MELDTWVAEGRVDADAQLLEDGDSQWQWARDVFPILAGVSTPQQSDNPFAFIDSGSQSSSFAAASTTGRSKRKRPHRGGLILTLAILGWLICSPLCVVAWVMGSTDLAAMKAGRRPRRQAGALSELPDGFQRPRAPGRPTR
jgi:hypothetical protein